MSTSCARAVVVRPRDPSDLSTLIQILTNVYNLTGYPVEGPSAFPAKLQPSNALLSLVALHNDIVAGHVQLLPASILSPTVIASLTALTEAPLTSLATLASLFVDTRLQGKGIGRRLVEEAMAWARKEGKRLALIVLEKDKVAIRMYERMGWVRGPEYVDVSFQGVEYKALAFLGPV